MDAVSTASTETQSPDSKTSIHPNLIESIRKVTVAEKPWLQRHPTCERLVYFSPLIAQISALIVGSIVLSLYIITYAFDEEWNKELRRNNSQLLKEISVLYESRLEPNHTSEILVSEMILRERRQLIYSIFIQSYVILNSAVHCINYCFCTDNRYRITFGKLLNIFLVTCSCTCIVLILHAMIDFNTNYGYMENIYIFRHCRIAENSVPQNDENSTLTLTEYQKSLLCQRFDLKFSAIGLGGFCVMIMLGILFFSKSRILTSDECVDTASLYDWDYIDEEEETKKQFMMDVAIQLKMTESLRRLNMTP